MEGQLQADGLRIVILGSGNVASHLAPVLDAVAEVVQIWSRTNEHAVGLASTLRNAEAVSSPARIDRTADLYIIAVADDAIAGVGAMVAGVAGIVAHTSGSFPLEELEEAVGTERVGVFYPLQTFSRDVAVELRNVPFLIEGKRNDVVECLTKLAERISDNVRPVDSTTRGHLHVAAVFANNFANYMWDVADRYLREHTRLDITVFEPLLVETLRKAMANGPHAGQTGPAKRGDRKVMDAHMAKLTTDDAEVYRLLSERIINEHKIDSKNE